MFLAYWTMQKKTVFIKLSVPVKEIFLNIAFPFYLFSVAFL